MIKTLQLKKRTDSDYFLLGRYGLVGILLFSIDFLVYTLLIISGYEPGLAQFCARGIGAISGYFLHRYFTFRKSTINTNIFFREGPAYLGLVCFNIVISPWLVSYLATATKGPFLGKITSECFLVAFTFFIMRFHIFKSDA